MKWKDERNFPGPGDEATWPPYSGHPNDPRYVDPCNEEEYDFEEEQTPGNLAYDNDWEPIK